MPILGIGKVVASGEKISVESPDEGKFMLTTLTKSQVCEIFIIIYCIVTFPNVKLSNSMPLYFE